MQKKLSKLISILLCAVMLLGIMPISNFGIKASAHEHVYSESWTYNTANHWHICTEPGCMLNQYNGNLPGFGPHEYDSDTDAECNVCNYKRTLLEVTLTHENGTTTKLTVAEDATDPNGKWSWAAKESKLTLNGWTGQGIAATKSFVMHMIGENIINMPSNATGNVYGISTKSGPLDLSADEGASLTISAQNITGSATYYGLYSVTLRSGTLNINMKAAPSYTGTMNGLYTGWFFIGESVCNIDLDANGSTCKINGIQSSGATIGDTATINLNIKGIATKAYNGMPFRTSNSTGPFKGKVNINIQGGSDSIAITKIDTLTLGEGGSVEFSGGYARLNINSSAFNRSANTQTTIPANDGFKAVYDEVKKELWMCDTEGNKLTAGKFEYVKIKPPFETVGTVKDGDLHVYTLPDLCAGDNTILYNWFNLYSVITGYEQAGQVHFEIVDGSLPDGLSIRYDISSSTGTNVGIGGIPSQATPAGSVIIKATENIGDMRSVQFKVRWNEIKPAHVHAWSTSWATNNNYHWHECTAINCKVTENSSKDSFGAHTGGNATCNSKAICSVCNEPYGTFNSLNHTGGTEVINAKAADHNTQTKGYTGDTKCLGCNAIIKAGADITPTAHNFEPANCTTPKTCKVDGCNYTEGTALGHNLTDVSAKAATCTEDGHKAYKKCTKCDYTEGFEKIAASHTLTNVAAKAATCTEKGHKAYKKCTKCDYTEGFEEIKALGHKEEVIKGKAATCTEKGKSDGKKCSVCGVITVPQKDLNALGHKIVDVPGKAATCTEKGLTDGKKCSVCGVVTVPQNEINAKGHTPSDWIVEKAATVDAEGLEIKKCTVCEAKLEERVIPKLTPSYILGDINGDGKVTATDARLILRIATKLEKLENQKVTVFAAADVNGDGKITATDARKVLRVSTKLEKF